MADSRNLSEQIAPPLEGGRIASHTSSDRLQEAHLEIGNRALYVLAISEHDPLNPPVFEVDDPERRTIAIFSNHNLALLYLQVAGWTETHETAQIIPHSFSDWLQIAQAKGVRD